MKWVSHAQRPAQKSAMSVIIYELTVTLKSLGGEELNARQKLWRFSAKTSLGNDGLRVLFITLAPRM